MSIESDGQSAIKKIERLLDEYRSDREQLIATIDRQRARIVELERAMPATALGTDSAVAAAVAEPQGSTQGNIQENIPENAQAKTIEALLARLSSLEHRFAPPASSASSTSPAQAQFLRPHEKRFGEAPRGVGRKPNEQLIAYLLAGHYQHEGNHIIAAKFDVAENTVRRTMWQLGLKREKQIRRRGNERKTKKKSKRSR